MISELFSGIFFVNGGIFSFSSISRILLPITSKLYAANSFCIANLFLWFISSLSATLETFAKIDTQQLTSSTSALSVSYGTPFLVAPKIAVTAQNMASGDFYEIGSITTSGFTITFKNSSGTIVARTFDYIARGF